MTKLSYSRSRPAEDAEILYPAFKAKGAPDSWRAYFGIQAIQAVSFKQLVFKLRNYNISELNGSLHVGHKPLEVMRLGEVLAPSIVAKMYRDELARLSDVFAAKKASQATRGVISGVEAISAIKPRPEPKVRQRKPRPKRPMDMPADGDEVHPQFTEAMESVTWAILHPETGRLFSGKSLSQCLFKIGDAIKPTYENVIFYRFGVPFRDVARLKAWIAEVAAEWKERKPGGDKIGINRNDAVVWLITECIKDSAQVREHKGFENNPLEFLL